MARIRSIKPELLEDEKTALLTHFEWRLFVSLLLIADDYGNLRANPRQIEGTAFWGVPMRCDVTGGLIVLQDAGLIRLYHVRGQAYAHITGWSKHQKVDKPGKPLCPGPDAAESLESLASPNARETLANDSRDTREGPENPRETLAPDLDLDLDQDQERENGYLRVAPITAPPQPAVAKRKPRKPKAAPEYPAEFERIWAETGRSGNKLSAFEAWEANGKPQPGSVVEGWHWAEKNDFRWQGADPHIPWLASWLNKRSWEDRPTLPNARASPATRTPEQVRAEEQKQRELQRETERKRAELAEQVRQIHGGTAT